MDLYKLLEIPEDADAKQIKKAYRVKALKCHPDKNPDNPNAANLFHQLSEALEVLSDIGARAAYDHLRKAKKLAQERIDKLDSKRKKVKLDLEAREKAAEKDDREKHYAKATMKQEIERLRDEGSRILEEEQRKLREELKREQELAAQNLHNSSFEPARLKVKWKASKGDVENGGYNESLLRKMFSKYGSINILLVSSKKRGSAVVEFKRWKDAELASIAEVGLPSNPLKIDLIGERPQQAATPSSDYSDHRESPADVSNDTKPCFPWAASYTANRSSSSATKAQKSSDDDFESQVLARLKKAQERKRQMQRESAQASDGT